MSNQDLFVGWVMFWGTYFIVAPLYPSDVQIARKSSDMTKIKLLKQLVVNVFGTLITIPLFSKIPNIVNTDNTIIKIILTCIISEVWFYYIHRLAHTKIFYRWHKDHHSFIQPYGLAGLYCSVIEMIFCNQLTTVLPIQLLNFSMTDILIFSCICALNVLKGHGGLQLKGIKPDWLVSSSDHDTHHHLMKYNYGIFYILDRIHKTYK